MHLDKIAVQPLPQKSCFRFKNPIVTGYILDERVSPNLSLQVTIALKHPPSVDDRTPSRSVINLMHLEVNFIKPTSSN